DNLQTLQLLSNYYQQMDQPSQAKQMLHKALEKNSRDPKTLVMLADIYVKETQWDSVSILLSNVIADPIIQKEAKLDVARYLFSRFNEEPDNNGLKNATEEVISKFTKHEPEYGQAHALAADFYLNTGKTGKGIEALAKTNELMPGNDAAWIERLRLLYVDGRYEEAAEVGEKADEHVPQETMILYLTGLSHLAIGQHKKAVDWLQKATTTPARKDIKSGIYDALASSYESLDQWQKASEAYETAIDIDPGNHQALNNYAYNLAERDEQLERAEEMALKAIRMVDSDNARASYLDTVGWIYFKKQDYEKARTYIQKSIDTGEASAEVLEHMGDVLEKLDRTEEARQWWRKALDKDSTRTYLKDKLSD
ncbi:MAG: tetratricopeptide repeat protein, partial [Balneolaceae bacterium]|nr:tetratricopeptide repeat protein [Balneolaceae bacterium]